MSGWYLYNKYRKTSIKLTLFMLVVIALAIIFRIAFPSLDNQKKNINDSSDKKRQVIENAQKK